MVRPSSWSGLWGSVTVQVLRAQAQPLPAKPCSLVKREILPINIQPSCLFLCTGFQQQQKHWWSLWALYCVPTWMCESQCVFSLLKWNPQWITSSTSVSVLRNHLLKALLIPTPLEFHKYSASTSYPCSLSSSLRFCFSLKVFVVLQQKFTLHKSKQLCVV